ncbi:MAG TPA: HAD family phosphatase [Actinocrinis sp.]|nr:HAD family phosphatase [Actinocrinis sp.]
MTGLPTAAPTEPPTKPETGPQPGSAAVAPAARIPGAAPTALIVDWGGVLTSPLDSAIAGWLDAEGIERDAYVRAMRDFRDPELIALNDFDPIAALEKGELRVDRFEQLLAERISAYAPGEVPADGLLGRMFAGFAGEPTMVNVVRRAKSAGLKTALLSNSWGNEYLREDWDAIFDAVVISGEVGMRKPEPEIYRHTLGLLGTEAQAAVFVDDLPTNVRGATAVGIIGVHHRSFEETRTELEALFGLELS